MTSVRLKWRTWASFGQVEYWKQQFWQEFPLLQDRGPCLRSCRQHYHQVNPTQSRDSFPPSLSLILGNSNFWCKWKVQPARIFVEFDIADAVFMTILLLAILFSLAWIIYLQELLDEWFLNAL